MKILSIYISSFGKLKDFSYDFTEGINTIKEDNGFGKSTIAMFIKAMFYGLNGKARSIASGNERLQFRPWNSSDNFGGYIVFERKNSTFKIERYFGKKESDDTVVLTDIRTGKTYNNVENYGERLFEIDEEGFLSTTYLSQKDIAVKSNTSLTSKFNAVYQENENTAYDKAIITLEKKTGEYKKNGNKGIIAEYKNKLFELDELIDQDKKAPEILAEYNNSKDNILNKINQIKTEQKLLDEQERIASKNEAIKLKKQAYTDAENRLKVINDNIESCKFVFNGNIPSEKEIDECIANYNNLRELKDYESQLVSKLGICGQEGMIKKANINILFILFYVLAAFCIVPAFIITLPFKWVLIGVGIVCWEVGLFLNLKESKKKNNCKRNNLQLKEQLSILQKRLEEIKTQKEYYENKINAFLNLFNVDKSDVGVALTNLKQLLVRYKNLMEEFEPLSNKVKALKSDTDLSLDEMQVDHNILSKKNNNQAKLDELARELAVCEQKIKMYIDKINVLDEKYERKEELIKSISKAENEYKIYSLTLEYLNKANENLKVKYREPLQNSLDKYIKLFLGDNKKVDIDIDFNLTVEETGGAKTTDFYSKGYQNLFEICKRFALTDVLFTNEKPFIILDDPFYNLDEHKIEKALELLGNLSKEYQILYLICHESRVYKA